MRNYTTLLLLFSFLFITSQIAAQDYGIATYYDDSFHGRRTSSGEIYNKNKLTAAYKKYDYGTILKVTRLDNKRSVRVRVIDNGPFIKGRLIELSRAAAQRLDMLGLDEVEVRVELVEKGEGVDEEINIESGEVASKNKNAEVEPYNVDLPKKKLKETVALTPPKKKIETKPVQKTTPPKATVVATKPTEKKVNPPKAKVLEQEAILVRKGDYRTYDLYKIQVLRPQRKGFGIQVAYISNYENVLKQIAELQDKWFKNILLSVEKGKNGKPIYKIILGPFPDEKTALSYKKRLKRKKKINGFLVDLTSLKY